MASHLADLLLQLVCCCSSLQVLHVSTSHPLHGTANIVFPREVGTRLNWLVLHGFPCAMVDLCSFPILRTVYLTQLDSPQVPCKVFLSESVQVFEFSGTSLFAAQNCEQLAHLAGLTKLVIAMTK